MQRICWLVLSLCFAILLGGCGNKGAPGESGDLQAFCQQAEDLDQLERPPTDEELDGLLEVVPAEIRDDAETLVESARAFRAGNENAADSLEIQAAGDRFDQFVEENCEEAT